MAKTTVSDRKTVFDLDSLGRLQRSAWTFAVPKESAIVQLASMHAAVL